MSIFKFWKKKKDYRATYNKLTEYLNKNRLIDISAKALPQEEMLDSFLPIIEKDESAVNYNFKENFKSIERNQRKLLAEMIDSNFDEESTESFFNNFKETVNSSFPLVSTNLLFISYWNQVVQKLREETLMAGNLIDKKLSEKFFIHFDEISKKEFKRLTNPNTN